MTLSPSPSPQAAVPEALRQGPEAAVTDLRGRAHDLLAGRPAPKSMESAVADLAQRLAAEKAHLNGATPRWFQAYRSAADGTIGPTLAMEYPGYDPAAFRLLVELTEQVYHLAYPAGTTETPAP